MITNLDMALNLRDREKLSLPVKKKGTGLRMLNLMVIDRTMDMFAEYQGDEEYVPLTPEQKQMLKDMFEEM